MEQILAAMTSWVPGFDASIVFSSTPALTPSSLSTTSPHAPPPQPLASKVFLASKGGKGTGGNKSNPPEFPTAGRARTNTLRPHTPTATGHFSLPTTQSTAHLPPPKKTQDHSYSMYFKGSATKNGVFQDPPRLPRPQIDFATPDRPWTTNDTPTFASYTSKSLPHSPKKHSPTKAGGYDGFGSSTPRTMGIGAAVGKRNGYMVLTAEDVGGRTPRDINKVHFGYSVHDHVHDTRAGQEEGGGFHVDLADVIKARDGGADAPALQAATRAESSAVAGMDDKNVCVGYDKPRFRALCYGLYQLTVVDVAVTDVASVCSFRKVLEWRVEGAISEVEFSALSGELERVFRRTKSPKKKEGDREASPKRGSPTRGSSPTRKGKGWGAVKEAVARRSFAPCVSYEDFCTAYEGVSVASLEVYVAVCLNERNLACVKKGVAREWLEVVQKGWFTMDNNGWGWTAGERAVKVAWGLCKLEGVCSPLSVAQVSEQVLEMMGGSNNTAPTGVTYVGFVRWCLKRQLGEREVSKLFEEVGKLNPTTTQGWEVAVAQSKGATRELKDWLSVEGARLSTRVCLRGMVEHAAREAVAGFRQFKRGRVGENLEEVVGEVFGRYKEMMEEWRVKVWGKEDVSGVSAGLSGDPGMVTPIPFKKDTSRIMLTVGTDFKTEEAEEKKEEEGEGKEPTKEKQQQQQQKEEAPPPPGAPRQTVIAIMGDFASPAPESGVDAGTVYSRLMKCEWTSGYVNDHPAPVVMGGEEGGGEAETLEKLVDSLLHSNDLSILDDIRKLREAEEQSPTPPPPPPPPQIQALQLSPSSSRVKKSRRGSELLDVIRALSPNRQGKEGGGGGGKLGLEDVMKLGLGFNVEDGEEVHASPILNAARAEEVNTVLKLS